MDCQHPIKTETQDSVCWAKTVYPKHYVEEYGYVKGPENMKAEIYARGPIACLIDATEAFEEYTGGVFKQ
jgi:cathepsin X